MTYRQNQYQVMTRTYHKADWRQVVDERKPRLKAVSADGIRADIVLIIIAMILMMLFSLLWTDISSLQSGERDIRKTTGRISEMKARISQFGDDLDPAPFASDDPDEDPLLIRMTVPEVTANPIFLSPYPSAKAEAP